MRNALLIFSLSGVFSVARLAAAGPVDVVPVDDAKISNVDGTSNYAPALTSLSPSDSSGKGLAIDQELLPVRGSDLPLPSAASSSTGSSAPQASVVEAIPTPTAFHAGGLLLIAMFAARYFRKLRVS